MPARLLLIEDEPALLAILQAAVAFGGFESDHATNGEQALQRLREDAFDAVLLDLGLPDTEGNELLPVVRDITDAPIIVVSGRGSEQDKIMALDLGADDFVAKPFLPGELLARIRAALRRYGRAEAQLSAARQPVQVGTITLDPLDRSARRGDGRAEFNRAEFKLLRRLAGQPNVTVSRADLMAELYTAGEEAPSESRIVDVYLSRIRTKLRGLIGDEEAIESVRGIGWTLRPPE